MKKYVLIISVLLLVLAGCKKTNEMKQSGTQTIETTLYGTGPYYALGFSFSLAQKISTLDDPGPDVTLLADVDIDGTIRRLMLQTDNFKNSFYKFGEYPDATAAESAFTSLKSASVAQWSEVADTVRANQIWLFRTASEKYAKFRIVSTIAEQRSGTAYGSCTFEWSYQPDGTLTFPGK
jgi:hypothetical protein